MWNSMYRLWKEASSLDTCNSSVFLPTPSLLACYHAFLKAIDAMPPTELAGKQAEVG